MLTVSLMPNVLADAKENMPKYRGQYTLNHDDSGQIGSVDIGSKNLISYKYTKDSLLETITYGNGDTIKYDYTQNGYLKGIKLNGQNNYSYEFKYDDKDQVIEKYDYVNELKTYYLNGITKVYKTTENGENFLYEYSTIENVGDVSNDILQTTSIQSANNVILNNVYGKDKTNIEYIYNDSADLIQCIYNGKSTYYNYDELHRLVRVNSEILDKTNTYKYDDNNNIISKSEYEFTVNNINSAVLIKTDTYNYGTKWIDQLSSYNGKKIKYDEIGNPLSYKGMTMSWNNGRGLEKLVKDNNVIEYKYDENGIRTSKTINGVTTNFATINGKIISQIDDKNQLDFKYDTNGQLSGVKINGVEFKYLKDLQGDVIALLDNKGNKVTEYIYDSWGNASMFGDTNLGKLNPMRYRGYYFDNESGFYYLQSRYYDSTICRFINADDFVLSLSLNHNSYAYCSNNPIYFVDYTGQYTVQSNNAIQAILPIINAIISNSSELAEDQKLLLATTAGEAIGSNDKCRQAVSSVIRNRAVSQTIYKVVSAQGQFGGYLNNEYNKCMNYLNSRTGSNKTYEPLIKTVIPVYYKTVADITKGCTLFYSPQSMKPVGSVPKDWDFSKLTEVTISGISTSEFRFYKYK